MELAALLLQLLTLLSALAVAVHPNTLHAAVYLLFSLSGVAGLYLLAGADFLAGAQILVYVGGVTILVLFAVLLLHALPHFEIRRPTKAKSLIAAVVVFLGLAPVLFHALAGLAGKIHREPLLAVQNLALSPKTTLIGQALLGEFILPFELLTFLVLASLVGAVWIARPR